ncbi:metalloregulator ArsR/SmtB family transcription factor [Streptomyces sp. NBC_00083]|uniref:ArsR/SmtB family transcription factor n=1 Tax=Streptomyces sp. NBC_00083 TaxID=2975647 RepID=UPI00225236DD|nr:metalloregulator ArsR/SmtB family transcription factor [Streptomyces sp. NBC_00083]MCX5386364.1 metalloregulator ArsR/SmtB family transcription factor [Streptomyces sp. NBC_00083]
MGVQVESWDDERAERAVAVLKAVADPSRYRLLWALSGAELPVSALAELLGAHVAATSQHLAKLRAAGLVTSRRDGTRIFYRAAGPGVRALLEEASVAALAASPEQPSPSPGPEAPTPSRAPRRARAPRPVAD